MCRWLLTVVVVATFAGALSVAGAPAPAEGHAASLFGFTGAPAIVEPSGGPDPLASVPDLTPPVTVASGADASWCRTSVTITLTATDDASGVASTWCRVDSGAFVTAVKVTVRAPADHSGDGVHAVAFYSVDNAGNVEAAKQVSVRIDTTRPRFTWVSLQPAVIYRQQPVWLRFTVVDASGGVHLTVVARDQYGAVARRYGSLWRQSGTQSYKLIPTYADGGWFLPCAYRVSVSLRDEAGNAATSSSRTFRDYRATSVRVCSGLPAAGRRVALTFDDGGSTRAWASILATLRAYRAHATFFLLKGAIAASPVLARRTLAEGNAIGSHGYSHAIPTTLSYEQVRAELLQSEVPWWSAARVTPVPYYRPPYGLYNSTTLAAAGSLGFGRVILWDVDPQDWSGVSSSAIAGRVLSHLHCGAIVCLHVGGNTAAALPAILEGMRSRGYGAVTLPALFKAAGCR